MLQAAQKIIVKKNNKFKYKIQCIPNKQKLRYRYNVNPKNIATPPTERTKSKLNTHIF